MEKGYPLIIVFYLDKELMKERQIIQPFVESVNHMLQKKEANALAFFIPTTGEERVECINPIALKEADMSKINTIIEDLTKSFDINTKIEMSEITPEKDCVCNGDGTCNCQK